MRVHAAPAGVGLGVHVGMRVKLGKKFLDAHHTQHEHPGLIAIITGAPVAFLKSTPNREVGKFFAVAKDAELGLAAQYFAPTNQTCLPRLIGETIIFEYLFCFKGERNRTLLLGHGLSP